jgi:hypothetical protein
MIFHGHSMLHLVIGAWRNEIAHRDRLLGVMKSPGLSSAAEAEAAIAMLNTMTITAATSSQRRNELDIG